MVAQCRSLPASGSFKLSHVKTHTHTHTHCWCIGNTDGQIGVLVTLMVNFIETGTECFWITCGLVACGHIVLGHSVAGDISQTSVILLYRTLLLILVPVGLC